jgi:sugar lactone lactonase YvrE
MRYIVLREQKNWDISVSCVGLETRSDGSLRLQEMPGLASSSTIRKPLPFEVPMSGVAVSENHTTYTAITDNKGRILIADCGCGCGDYTVIDCPVDDLIGVRFKTPCGLLVVDETLLIADSGNGRVLLLDLPSLRQRGEWKTGLQQPSCLAADSLGRIYVVDSGKVLRFSATGTPDDDFNNTTPNPSSSSESVAIAVDANDQLYVSDAAVNAILRFNETGAAMNPVLPPHSGIFKPRAITAAGQRLYVADADSGYIWVYEITSGAWLGTVESYQGPVSALVTDSTGTLYVKSGADDTTYRFEAHAACVRNGPLLAGPFDAGEGEVWERVWVDVEALPQTETVLEVAVSDQHTLPPNGLAWQTSPSLDVLLTTLVDTGIARFLWLRVTLKSLDGRSTPTVLQVQAATAAPSYLDYLPRIYRRNDSASGFLAR